MSFFSLIKGVLKTSKFFLYSVAQLLNKRLNTSLISAALTKTGSLLEAKKNKNTKEFQVL